MSADLRSLALRLVKSPRFRWELGMPAMDRVGMRRLEMGQADGFGREWAPDLEHPAMGGWLFSLLTRGRAQVELHRCPDNQPELMLTVCADGEERGTYGGDTLAEACARALLDPDIDRSSAELAAEQDSDWSQA